MARVTPAIARHKAQRMKVIIVNKLLQHIERDDVSVSQLSKLTRINQARIHVLLNPCVPTLDLYVLVSVCQCLSLRIRINNTSV
jgi:hypothetical protein